MLEEFFELFKTPWEYWQQDKAYDVVILSRDEDINSLKARMVIIFGAESTRFDKEWGIKLKPNRYPIALSIGELRLPIYTGLSSIKNLAVNDPVIRQNGDIVGFKIRQNQRTILRVGYDFFMEINYLLCVGQPAEYASIPTLEIHIALLKTWILAAGIPVIEIPPVPEGYNFIVCLTHDTDFIKVRNHALDHSLVGFLYRAFFGSSVAFLRGRIPFSRVVKNWKAVFSLPFVFLGKAEDFWFQFDRYIEIEKGNTSTFFLVPFKNRRGEKVDSFKRATKYDIMDMRPTAERLIQKGHEIGVHGIDAWHNHEKGSQELQRINCITGEEKVGIRMHWLLFDDQTFSVLEKAGYHYDSTLGYNDAVGYRNGTVQVFRPSGAIRLLELPLNIQDTALFYPRRMNLSEKQAKNLCDLFVRNALRFGGVVTINWHQRSLAPERLWGDFYLQLLARLRDCRPWFATCSQAVDWFQKRRDSSFDIFQGRDGELRLNVRTVQTDSLPGLSLSIHSPKIHSDTEVKAKSLSVSADNHIGIPLESSPGANFVS